MNENVEVDSSTPISYGDLRISSDRRKGPCLFWVCIVYTLSRPALSGHERLSHHICELQFRWFLMWPRASMWQTSTPSSWPTADLLKGHRKAAGSLLPNVRARASAPATTPHCRPRHRANSRNGHAHPVSGVALLSSGPAFFPSALSSPPQHHSHRSRELAAPRPLRSPPTAVMRPRVGCALGTRPLDSHTHSSPPASGAESRREGLPRGGESDACSRRPEITEKRVESRE